MACSGPTAGNPAPSPTPLPAAPWLYGPGYASDQDADGRLAPRDGFAPLSAAQLASVHAALEAGPPGHPTGGFAVEGFASLAISYAGRTIVTR